MMRALYDSIRIAATLIVAAGCLTRTYAQSVYEPYAFTTLAGLGIEGGTSGAGSTDGSGNEARFNLPHGLCSGPDGSMYIADTQNQTIRRITASGEVTTIAGSAGVEGTADGIGTTARFMYPRGIAADESGNIYIADTGSHTIRKIDVSGVVTTIAGLAGSAGSADGVETARFFAPWSIAADDNGNLYVADYFNSSIRKISSSGIVTTLAGLSGQPGAIDGLLADARFSRPSGLVFDADDNLYVSDASAGTIRKITPAGQVMTIAGLAFESGSDDGVGSAARFGRVTGLAMDSGGNMFIADTYLVRKLSSQGVVTTLAGAPARPGVANGIGADARFRGAVGIALGSGGTIYIADSENHVIRAGVPTAPAIISQPVDQIAIEGTHVEIAIIAESNVSNLIYQWRKNGQPISGAVEASYEIANVTFDDAAFYDVLLTDSYGSKLSASMRLKILNAGPAISALSSTRQVFEPGQVISLAVSAAGSGPLTFQWLREGRIIPGATESTYVKSNASSADASWYEVLISDSEGVRRSPPMFVSVVPLKTQLIGWGVLYDGAPNVPFAADDTIAVSGRLALRRDGTVFAWGPNYYGETSIPPELNDVVAVSETLALRKDGTVKAWGSNVWGQTDIPPTLDEVVAIASGGRHCLALRNDGTVEAWGYNLSGEATVPVGLADVRAVAAGGGHSLALKQDGTVVAWGDNGFEQCTVPSGLNDVVQIAAGDYFSLALKRDGSVHGWGMNYDGQLDIPSVGEASGVAAGTAHALAMTTSGTVSGWGHNYHGQSSAPTTLADVLAISARGMSSVALRNASLDTSPIFNTNPVGGTYAEGANVVLSATVSGTVPLTYQWRKNGVNILHAKYPTLQLPSFSSSDAGDYDLVVSNYLGSASSAVAALEVTASPTVTTLSDVRQVLTPGQDITIAIAATGNGSLSYQWMHNGRSIPGAVESVFNIGGAADRDSGWYVALVTDSVGTRRSPPIFVSVMPLLTEVRGWGVNPYGQITPPADLDDAIAISAFTSRCLAVRRDGTVVGWGSDIIGESTVPADLSGVVDAVAGSQFSVALRQDASVVVWGPNTDGILSVPAGLTDVVAISAAYHILALKSNGTVVAWGNDSSGSTNVPVGLADVVAIAAGETYSLALKRDGTVVGWGSNTYGQISIPAGLSGVVSIAAQGYQSLALKSDGTVVRWGLSWNGPTFPRQLREIIAVACGGAHALALTTDRTVIASGGSAQPMAVVVPSDLGNVIRISAADGYSIALRDVAADTAPIITVGPLTQTRPRGQPVTLSIERAGAVPFTYQWRKNGVPIAGATERDFHLPELTWEDEGNFDVVVTNPLGSATSSSATLSIVGIPQVTSLGAARRVLAPGAALDLEVAASGIGVVAYQWTRNGQVILGATSSRISIEHVSTKDSGYYVVIVSDDRGPAYSKPFFVNVAPLVTQVVVWGSGDRGTPDVAGVKDAIAIGDNYLIHRAGTIEKLTGGTDGIPAGLNDVVATAYGGLHSLALQSDGTIVAWGDNSYGKCDIPVGLSDVVAIAAGWYHSVALRSNGRVVTWGANVDGQMNVPSALREVTALFLGHQYTFALKRDGSVSWWGDGWSDSFLPEDIGGPITAVDLTTSSAFVVIDGRVQRWGSDANGSPTDPLNPPSTLSDVARVIASPPLALKEDGTVVAWGYGSPTTPAGLNGVLAIHAENGFSIALRADLQVNDFNRDGAADLLWQNTITGHRGIGLMEGTVESGSMIDLGTVGLDWSTAATGDFNSDGKADLVWQNTVTGQRGFWLMDGTNLEGDFVSMETTPVEWSIVGAGDFNGDGKTDLVWQNTVTGERGFWLMNGTVRDGAFVTLATVPTEWSIAAVGDFNADGMSDLIWQNGVTGQRSIWLMNGMIFESGAELGFIPVEWQISGAGDFNYDGRADLVWENRVTGQRGFWLMNGTVLQGGLVELASNLPIEWTLGGNGQAMGAPAIIAQPQGGVIAAGDSINLHVTTTGVGPLHYQWFRNGQPLAGATGAAYTIASGEWPDAGTYTVVVANFAGTVTSIPAAVVVQSRTVSDFNGDAKTDLIWQNEVTGQRVLWLMNGTQQQGTFVDWGTTSVEWWIAATGDFNGDDHADIVWQNTVTGQRGFWLMHGAAVQGDFIPLETVAVEWNIAGAGDFNGDGQSDLVWENCLTGERGLWLLNGTAQGGFVSLGTVSTDWSIAAVGDFNGDGKPDLVWQNTDTGQRSVWLMNGTIFESGAELGFITLEWRIAKAGDYNGDDQTDLVWENTTTGQRGFWLMSGTNVLGDFVNLVTLGLEWSLSGLDGALPSLPASDFNDDGKPDLIWQNRLSGQRVVWLMNGTLQQGSYVDLGLIPVEWEIAGVADFNGDGHSDLVWQNEVTGLRGFWLMNGTNLISEFVPLITVSPEWSIAGSDDFDSDGKPDLVLQNTVSGERGFWLLDGMTLKADFIPLITVSPNWHIAAAGDFNDDAKADLVLENTVTGQRGFWLLNNTQLAADFVHLSTVPTEWRIGRAGDFNGDHKPDLVWQNSISGQRGFWLMEGITPQSDFVTLATLSPDWSLAH